MNYRPLTGGSLGRIESFATDGERAYFTVHDGRETRQVALTGGASAPLELPFAVGYVVDASKPRASLLMLGREASSTANDFPLWSVPVPAGGARKLGLEVSTAAWSPDGQKLAFVRATSPVRLGVARGDGSEPSTLFEAQGLDSIKTTPRTAPPPSSRPCVCRTPATPGVTRKRRANRWGL